MEEIYFKLLKYIKRKNFILGIINYNLYSSLIMDNTPLHMIADPEQRAYRIAFLICEFIKGSLDDTHIAELDEWLQTATENQLLFAELTNPGNIRKEIQPRLN